MLHDLWYARFGSLLGHFTCFVDLSKLLFKVWEITLTRKDLHEAHIWIQRILQNPEHVTEIWFYICFSCFFIWFHMIHIVFTWFTLFSFDFIWFPCDSIWSLCWSKIYVLNMNFNILGSKKSNITKKQPKKTQKKFQMLPKKY